MTQRVNPKLELNGDLTILQSKTIDLLRFPLAIMVVFIHMNPPTTNLIDADFSLWSWPGIFNVIGILLSHTFSALAVPTFFLISGFLFFINIQKWDWSKYRLKIKKRLKTLIIPYLLWNLTPFLLFILYMLFKALVSDSSITSAVSYAKEYSWHIFYDCNVWGENRVNWLGHHLRMTGPFDLPLWFLRDLIVVTIASPLIFWAVKRFKIFTIILLFLAYISRIWPIIPGINITAWFFFSAGSYLAISKINITEWARKYAPVFIPLSIILLTLSVIYDGMYTLTGQNILPLFICAGVPSIIYIASACISRFQIIPNKFLVSGCFFIYALHGVQLPYFGAPLQYISHRLTSLALKITGTDLPSYPTQLAIYLISPFVTVLACLLILKLGRRIAPRLTLLFSGNK